METAQNPEAVGDGLYTRKASGLVREIGLRDAFAINVAGVSFGAVIVVLLFALSAFENADLTWPIVIAAALLVPVTLVYGQLTAAMPRSGGDYVFVGRIIHPSLGAAVGFALLVTIGYGAGFSATFLGGTYLPTTFQALDQAFGSTAFANTASSVTTNTGLFWSGAGLIVFAGLVGLLGVRWLARSQVICIGLGLLSLAALIVTFWAHDNSSFQSAFNAAANKPNAYSAVIQQAHAGGWSTGATLSGVIGVLPFAFLLYLGFTYTVYPAGEVKSPAKTVQKAILAALAGSTIFYLLVWLGFVHLVGLQFAQAASYLGVADPTAAGKLTSTALTPSGFALLMMGNPVSEILLALIVVWGVSVELLGILVCSRILFALSNDRLLPGFITYVSPRRHSPVVAVGVAVIIFLASLAAGIYTGTGTALRNSTLMLIGIMLLSSVSATLMPWLQPDLYEAAPKPYGTSWFGLPPVAVAGAVSTVVLAVVLYLAATKPQLSGGYDRVSVTTLLVASLGGFVAYGISKLWLQRKGTDLGLALRELPPD